MALAYVQPGVTVTELTSQLQTPFIASGSDLCLIGLSAGYQTAKDNVTLTGTTPVALPTAPQTATMTSSSILTVTDAVSTAIYSPSSDITFAIASTPGQTSLATAAGVSDTTLTVASTTGFPSSGVLLIDNEQISYTAVTSTTFTGCVRGQGGTAPSTHSSDATVLQAKYTVARQGSNIPSGNVVSITYTYTAANYYTATRFDNLGAIQDMYGPAMDINNNIISDLTYGAQLAFENGAAQVICQPLFYNSNGVPSQPVAGASSSSTGSWAAAGTWGDTMTALRDIDDIDIVVPVIGQNKQNVGDNEMISNVFPAVQDYLAFMDTQQSHIVAIFGEDSTTTTTTEGNLQTHAATIQARQGGAVNQQIAFISPAKYVRQLPSSQRTFNVGGQYMAASIGGALAGRAVSNTLTREIITGYLGVGTTRTKAQKNADAQAGLMVLEQRGTAVQCRHAITLDQTSTATRELSVVRAKNVMISSVRDTLENNVIGQVIADGDAPTTVINSVASVLELLKGQKTIVDYGGVQARTLTLDPTTVEVRFSYKPAFPLNYINVIFSLDLTTGAVTGG